MSDLEDEQGGKARLSRSIVPACIVNLISQHSQGKSDCSGDLPDGQSTEFKLALLISAIFASLISHAHAAKCSSSSACWLPASAATAIPIPTLKPLDLVIAIVLGSQSGRWPTR